MNAFAGLINDQAIKCNFLVLPLKALTVLPQAAKIGLHNLHDLVLTKGYLVESAFHEFFLEGVGVLTLEDEIIGIFITTIAIFLKAVVCMQLGNRLALAALVFFDYLLHACA
jgi:hypothetical protein